MSDQPKIIPKPALAQFIPFFLWLLLIFILLTLPSKDFAKVDMRIPFEDKLVHMGLFGGLVFFFGFAYRKLPFAYIKTKLVFMVLMATAYGVVMEFIQKYYTHQSRSFSYDDMMADGLGAIIGYFLIRYVVIRINKKRLK